MKDVIPRSHCPTCPRVLICAQKFTLVRCSKCKLLFYIACDIKDMETYQYDNGKAIRVYFRCPLEPFSDNIVKEAKGPSFHLLCPKCMPKPIAITMSNDDIPVPYTSGVPY